MGRSFKLSTLRNPTKLAGKLAFTGRATVDGQAVSLSTEPAAYLILSGIQTLKENRVITNTKRAGKMTTRWHQQASITNLTSEAQTLLSGLGCTIDISKKKDYSLIIEQTDEEVVQNPNIQDSRLTNMKNRNISATDKFADTDEAFYALDMVPDSTLALSQEIVQNEIAQSGLAIQKVAADICAVNLSPGFNTQLVQFK